MAFSTLVPDKLYRLGGERSNLKSRESWLLMLSIAEPSTAARHPQPGSHFPLWISFILQPRSSVSLGSCPLGILSHLACPLYRPSVRKAIRLTLLHWNINTIQLPSPNSYLTIAATGFYLVICSTKGRYYLSTQQPNESQNQLFPHLPRKLSVLCSSWRADPRNNWTVR